jgi:hypothetical protein
MAATHDLVNSTDTAITGWGGSAVNVAARTYAVAQTLTDAQAISGAVTGSCAVLKASSTAAQRALIAGLLLDVDLSTIDTSTFAARESLKLKLGVQEGQDVLRAIGA